MNIFIWLGVIAVVLFVLVGLIYYWYAKNDILENMSEFGDNYGEGLVFSDDDNEN